VSADWFLWRAADFDQFESERFDPGQYPEQSGLVGQRATQHGVWSPPLRPQSGESAQHRFPRWPLTRTS